MISKALNLESLWQDYHQRLLAFLKSQVAEDVAEDLLHDIFIKIHANIDTLKDQSKVEAWLFQITRNGINDHYRQQSSEPLPNELMQDENDETDMIRQQLSSCLKPMIKHLPEKYRTAIQLSEIERKTQQHIADLEGISLSAAKSRVQRGRQHLKGILYQCCHIETNSDQQLIDYQQKNNDCHYC